MFKEEKDYGIETTGPLPLIIHAALLHPEWTIRKRLWKKLNDWLDSLGPKHTVNEVEVVIRNFKGTTLEPFFLDQKNLHAAIFLTRLAFTKIQGQTRIRINSQDNPLNRGGLVLTHNLKTYFIEHLASAKYTCSPKTHWVYNPGREPIRAKLPPKLPAKGWIGGHGYEASLDMKHIMSEGWTYEKIEIPNLLRHSFLKGTNEALINLGFDAWKSHNRLHIAIARPELMIKLGPRISSQGGISLLLDQHPEQAKTTKISLHMEISEEQPKPLTAQVILGKTDLGGWIHTSCGLAPELDEKLIAVLKHWGPLSSRGYKTPR